MHFSLGAFNSEIRGNLLSLGMLDCVNVQKRFFKTLLLGPKKNNCLVWLTSENTLGRVGRLFFLQLLDDQKNGFLAFE